MSEWLGDPVAFTMMRKELTVTDIVNDIKTIAEFLHCNEEFIQKRLSVNSVPSLKTKFYFERYHQRHVTVTYPIQQQYKDAVRKLAVLKSTRISKRIRWDELNKKDDLSYKNWGNDVVVNTRTKPEDKEFRLLTKSIDSLNYQIRGLQQKINELKTACTEEILK